MFSRQIAFLEKELGSPLFIRNTRSVTITSLGEQFLPQTRALLHTSESFFDKSSEQAELIGTLRVGCGIELSREP